MTSPSWDWAYSVIPTIAVSPSHLTHSWLSLNRIPLTSGIASPFLSFGMRSLVKGEGYHLRRRRASADVDFEPRLWFRKRRRHIGHRDVVAEREGDVPRADHPKRSPIPQHTIAMTRNISIEHLQTRQPPVEPSLARPHDGVPADEILVKAQRPLQACFERIGLVIHVVPVEPHARFQAECVAGPQAGRTDTVGLALREQRPPEPAGIVVSAE